MATRAVTISDAAYHRGVETTHESREKDCSHIDWSHIDVDKGLQTDAEESEVRKGDVKKDEGNNSSFVCGCENPSQRRSMHTNEQPE